MINEAKSSGRELHADMESLERREKIDAKIDELHMVSWDGVWARGRVNIHRCSLVRTKEQVDPSLAR